MISYCVVADIPCKYNSKNSGSAFANSNCTYRLKEVDSCTLSSSGFVIKLREW